MIPPAPSILRRRVVLGFTFLIVLALAFPGCGSKEQGMARKAETVYRETMAKEPTYAVFGVTLAADGQDRFSQQIIIESLGSENFRVINEALESLEMDLSPEVEAALVEMFQTRKGAMKLKCAVALGRSGNQEALSWLQEELARSGGMLSSSAMTLIAEKGDQELLWPELEKRLRNDDLSIRNETYVILGEIGQPWSDAMLAKGLDNERGEERVTAIEALGRSGNPERSARVQRFTNTQGLVFASIEALGELGNPDSVAHLAKMTDHEEDLVRAYLSAALWKLGDIETARGLAEELASSEDPAARKALAEQLGGVEDDGVISVLSQLAADADGQVNIVALRSLVDRDSVELRSLYSGKLGSKDYETASVALRGLARIGDSTVLPELEPLLASSNPYTAISAAHAILAILDRTEPA